MPGIDRQEDGHPGVRLARRANGLHISRNDQLELTLEWRNPSRGGIYMRYFNAPENSRITGTALNLTTQGKLAGGVAGENFYNKKWRFNSPAIRLKLTQVPTPQEEAETEDFIAHTTGLLIIVGLLFLYLKERRCPR